MLSIIAVALCVGIIIGYVWNLFDKGSQPYRYHDIVTKYAEKYGVDEKLIYSVIKVESHFNRYARSRSGALGLMQMLPKTFNWLTSQDHLDEHLTESSLYDPEVSIRYGVYYLKYLSEKFEDQDTVIAAYNGGEGNVTKWLSDKEYSDDGITLKEIPRDETRSYVKKVHDAMKDYENLIKK